MFNYLVLYKGVKMKCPIDNVECEKYSSYESIGVCPVCKGLFTTSSGDEIEILKMKNGGLN